MQFTMRRMMTWVVLVGVMLTIARYSAVRWGSEGLTYLAYWTFFAVIMAPSRRPGRWAMFWAGFGGFGMFYLVFTNFGFLSLPFRLPTGLILDGVYDRLPAGVTVSAIDFHRAGHVLFAVLAGVIGGLVFAAQVRTDVVVPEPEAVLFRARVRASFPTVFGLWDRMRSGRG